MSQIEIYEEIDQARELCENTVTKQQYADVILEESACSIEVEEDSIIQEKTGSIYIGGECRSN